MTDLIRAQGLGAFEAIQLTSWPVNAPIKTLELNDEIHVWRNHRVGRECEFDRYFPHLSLSEQQKSKSFSFDQDREDYVVGRGVLRKILSRYLGRSAKDIELRQNAFGKPYVVDQHQLIQFSQSQSGNEQVLVFTRFPYVGIDIEYIDTGVDIWPLAQQYFSNREMDQLLALPIEKRIYGFFKCWTQKESYMKALGLGYEFSCQSFDTLVDPEMDPQLIRSKRPGDCDLFRFVQLEISSSGHSLSNSSSSLPSNSQYSCTLSVARRTGSSGGPCKGLLNSVEGLKIQSFVVR